MYRALTETARRHLAVIENFILYITHKNMDDLECQYTTTPAKLYAMAQQYIHEDHVDGMNLMDQDAPSDRYKVITAKSAEDLTMKVAQYLDEGWVTDGTHQVVVRIIQNRFSGSQHMSSESELEYSQTLTH